MFIVPVVKYYKTIFEDSIENAKRRTSRLNEYCHL